MSLIDSTYFIREINIAQLGQPAVAETVQDFIDRYENELIYKAMGYTFGKMFLDGLLVDLPDQRWLDIKNGKAFTSLSGYGKKWVGFTNTELKSPIANYVYWKYMRALNSPASGIGIVQPQAENATKVNPNPELCAAYDQAVKWLWCLREFLNASSEVYPEYKSSDVHCFTLENQFSI